MSSQEERSGAEKSAVVSNVVQGQVARRCLKWNPAINGFSSKATGSKMQDPSTESCSIISMDELVGVIIQSHVRQLEAMQDANM